MKISLLLIALFVIGCSSVPKKDYRVNDFNQTSLDYINLADKKRQQEAYGEAVELYLVAESYALRSNNQHTIGISKLKRAIVKLVQGDLPSARILIAEVEEANQIENLELNPAINFVKAKTLLADGQNEDAFLLLVNLETHYQSNIEKNSYYRLLRWSYDYKQIDQVSVQKIIDTLTTRFNDADLDNIEVLSFAYMEHARWAADHASLEQGEIIIQQSTAHFSFLELPLKIALTLKLASNFYGRHNMPVKSDYYLAGYQKLININQ
ncbi:MAG: hypothetical protein ACI9JR_002628 [Gammaproteobacteria bacterium]|jgi:hypothetical protein